MGHLRPLYWAEYIQVCSYIQCILIKNLLINVSGFHATARTNISVVEPMYQSLKNYWDECPDDVQTSYGKEYLEHFKVLNFNSKLMMHTLSISCTTQNSLRAHMERAKPEGKISEVVDDMADAVAGADPLVPNAICLSFLIKHLNLNMFSLFSYDTYRPWTCNSVLAFWFQCQRKCRTTSSISIIHFFNGKTMLDDNHFCIYTRYSPKIPPAAGKTTLHKNDKYVQL